jgi:type III secretion protein Q
MRAEAENAIARPGTARRPLRFNALARANGTPPARHCYGFALTSERSGESLRGRVWTDVAGLSFAAPLLRAAARGAPAQGDWLDAIAVPVRLEAGATVLERAELQALEAGDLILLDDCWLAPGGEMSISAGAGLAFRARLEAQTLTVTQPLGPVMADAPSTPANAAAAERLPVRLTFDLGERSMTVAELRDLKPGYTFDLGRELRRAVSIRAHGQVIGEGELVEIDGTLGVAVTSLGGPAK